MTTLTRDCYSDCFMKTLSKLLGIHDERSKWKHWHQCGGRKPTRSKAGKKLYPGWDKAEGCGAIWSHRECDLDPFADKSGHHCPDCGKVSLWAYDEAEMRTRNRGKAFDRRYRGNGNGIRKEREPAGAEAGGESCEPYGVTILKRRC